MRGLGAAIARIGSGGFATAVRAGIGRLSCLAGLHWKAVQNEIQHETVLRSAQDDQRSPWPKSKPCPQFPARLNDLGNSGGNWPETEGMRE